MKHKILFGALLAVATVAFTMQSSDLAGSVDAATAIAKPIHANAADSGIRIDRAGYQCQVFEIFTGQADNGTATGNVVVVLDSIPGTAAWQLKDSLTVDTVDNKMYEIRYGGTQRWVRLLARASGQAADTFAINGALVQGCKRSR
mgnify:CR=1 FL=1